MRCEPPASTTPLANNQVSGLTYDADGNVINDGVNQYVYDQEGRLCAVRNILGGGATQYIYDAEGTRVAKGSLSTWPSAGSTCASPATGFTLATQYILDVGNNQMTETDGSGNWTHSNTWVATRLDSTYDTSGLHFHLVDPLGTRRIQSNPLGLLEVSYRSLPFGNRLTPVPNTNPACTTANHCFTEDPTEHHFTGKERDSESGNDYFGARYYASSMGRWLSPDPAGVAFSNLSNPQSWNLYSYVLNNPLIGVDPDGRECVWSDGSFDSKDDPDTGSIGGCQNAGGVYYDPSTFTAGNGQDWSAAPNAELAGQYQEAMDLAAQQPQGPDPSSATNSNTSTNGTTTTINLFGPNWQSTQVSTGTHPWRDNNPGDIISGRFVNNHGAIGSDGRFGVFPTAGTGSNALDSLLRSPTYSSKSISDAIATYAPAFENNTAGYQQFLTNALGVSGNTPLSSLSSSQMQTLENAISAYEGYNARGNYSVTTTSVITVP